MSKVSLPAPIRVGRLVDTLSTPPLESKPTHPIASPGEPRTMSWVPILLVWGLFLLFSSVGVLAAAFAPVRQKVTVTVGLPTEQPPPEPVLEIGPVARLMDDPLPMPREVKVVVWQRPGGTPATAEPAKESACDRFGTKIDFVRSQSVAFLAAQADQRLVVALHVAGNFEDTGFT
ncbi:MAG TPA: hypothetical protein VKE40_17860 [Gemmataceae bacterium]|nr:hypothetical protein [Gemmataceae bacterium]